MRDLCFWLTALFFALTAPLWGQHLITTIPVGSYPTYVDVNEKTNRIYVVNSSDHSMSVIDGASHTVVDTVALGSFPEQLAVNSQTNRIYVALPFATGGGVLAEYSGTTDTLVTTIPVPFPLDVVVNPVTNRIFVFDEADNQIVVVDGKTNTVIAYLPATNLGGIAINSQSNLIYLTCWLPSGIAVFDGKTNQLVTTLHIPGDPAFSHIAVDSADHRLYVVTSSLGLSVLDASTGALLGGIPNLGGSPTAIVAIPNTNLAISDDGGIRAIFIDVSIPSVYHEAPSGKYPYGIAFNKVTKLTYIADRGSNTVSVLGR